MYLTNNIEYINFKDLTKIHFFKYTKLYIKLQYLVFANMGWILQEEKTHKFVTFIEKQYRDNNYSNNIFPHQ